MNCRLLPRLILSLSLALIAGRAVVAQTSEQVARQKAIELIRSKVGLRPDQFLDIKRDEGLEERLVVSAGRRIPPVFIFKLNSAGFEVKDEKIIQHSSTDADLLYIVAISSADGTAYPIRGFANSLNEFGRLMVATKVKVSTPYQAEAVADFYRQVNPDRISTTPIHNIIELKQTAERQCQSDSFDTTEENFDIWWKHSKPLYAKLQFGETANSDGKGYIAEWTVLSSSSPGLCGGVPLRARLEVSSNGQVGKLGFSPYSGYKTPGHTQDSPTP